MKVFRFILLIILIPVVLWGQDHHTWTYNKTIYEVNVRQYTAAGTFAAFESHLNRLKNLGVGILWFMPIHPIGLVNRLGSLGSYYSVKDYYGVNPEFGTLDDFKALVDSIHAKGMYVIMDWVANHTSWDNDLTVSHPEWYVHDGNGNFVPPPGTGWTDVIQLDYSKQGLRDYMINAMKYWINEVHVDGFRCDAVSLMPLDFWTDAIAQLKTLKPDIFMIAEDDGTQYQAAGFDMTYAWGYHGFGGGVLVNIANGTNNANTLMNYINQENTNFDSTHYRMYFTSNHDENSWYGTDFEEFGNATEACIALTTSFRSMPLIYSGEEAGLDHRLLFFDKDQIIWRTYPLANVYTKILNLKKENKALWNGTDGGQLERISSTDNTNVFAFIREKDECRVFEVFNLSDQTQTFTLQGTSYVGNYQNVFTGDSISFPENTNMTLPAWNYKIYEYGTEISDVKNDFNNPNEFNLSQNYPNPFNPNTKIEFNVHEYSYVTLKVYNVLGKEVKVLVDRLESPGTYKVTFNADKLSSGIYFYVLHSGEHIQTKKMVLIK